MNNYKMKLFAVMIIGGFYWHIAGRVADVAEPWDAPDYWHIWYPGSLIISGVAGYCLRSQGWWAGLVIAFAQLPVIWHNNEIFIAPVSILFLGALAIPAMTLSYFAGRIADRDRNR